MLSSRRDFPFHDGQPFTPSALQWTVAMASVVLGLTALMFGERLTGAGWPGVLLFVGAPLAGLALLCHGRLGLVLAPPGLKVIGVGLGFGILNLLAVPLIGWIVALFTSPASNPVEGSLAALSDSALPAFFALTGVQLIGEELVTVIPFLAALTLLRKLGIGRTLSVGVAALTAALLFAAMHFPTYQWQVVPTVLIIGSARLILLAAYLATKNLWASVVAHIFNDWMLFGLLILLPRIAA